MLVDIYSAKCKMNAAKLQECHLDELGYHFVKKCIKIIEARGLDDQGLYRIGGVNSRVTRLLQMCLDRKNYDPSTGRITMPDFSDPVEWETKTITSALKNYLRNLSEPLMTFKLHPNIIEAAKIEDPKIRTSRIKNLIQQLPVANFTLLKLLVDHLKNIASHSQKNLMTVSNLGICFAPTLMRGPDENTLSIMEIKYSNVVANTLIEDYEPIFNDPKMNQTKQSYVNAAQPFQLHPTFPMINNHNDQLGFPNQQQYNNQNLQHQMIANVSHPNKPFKSQNGSNDLAQFSLKNYDRTSRPTTFISNSIAPIDIRPINDLKTYSYDQAMMVPAEQPYQYMGGSMNNSLNYLGYFNNQASSHPNSLTYSSSSLSNVTQGDHFNNNKTPLNSFSYYPLHTSKLPYSNKVVTLFACVADTESELSFGPNEVITDVRFSAEVGWLVGTLERNGQRGLLPENYVKFI